MGRAAHGTVGDGFTASRILGEPGGEPGSGWVEEELPGGWRASYRVTRRPDNELVISEVRLLPSDENHSCGRWSGDPADVPAGGITARMVRKLRVGAALIAATRWIDDYKTRPHRRRQLLEQGLLLTWRDDAGGSMPFSGVVASEGPRSLRREHSDEFFVELADAYVRLCAAGSTRPVADLAASLRDQNVGYSPTTVRDLIGEARRRGLITPAPPGRQGGELTARALAIVNQVRDDRREMRRRSTWVQMTHPEIPHTDEDPVSVSLDAFEDVWAPRGWQLKGDER